MSGFFQPTPAETEADVALSRPGEPVSVRVLGWFAAHRRLTLVTTLAYLASVIVLHDVLQQPAYWAQGQLSHRRWNNLVTAVSLPILLAFCVWIAAKVRRHPRPRLSIAYLALTTVLAVISFRTLLVMNIEVVHFPQYAILAVLLFALTGSYAATMVWATLGAMVDEAYQYFCLYADRWIHYDFNDVLLDTIGAGFGLVLVFVISPASHRWRAAFPRPVLEWLQYRSMWTAALVAAVCGWMYRAGSLRMLADAEHHPSAVVLRRGGPATVYWTETTWGKTYHQLHPVEWLALTTAIVAVYGLLDLIRVDRSQETRPA